MRTSVHQDNQRIYKGLKGQHVKLRGRSRNRKQQNGLNDELRPRIYENLEDLENLRSDWEALLSQFPCTTSFSTLEWLIPWWRAFGSDDRLQVVAFRDALESLVGVAPLALGEERSFGSKLRLLRLMGDGSHRRALEEMGRGIRNLAFLDPQPSDKFPDVLAAADVLLVNERATVRDMSLPSKLTSYFACGRPVVAAVRSDGTTAETPPESQGDQGTSPDKSAGTAGPLPNSESLLQRGKVDTAMQHDAEKSEIPSIARRMHGRALPE